MEQTVILSLRLQQYVLLLSELLPLHQSLFKKKKYEYQIHILQRNINKTRISSWINNETSSQTMANIK